MASELKIVGPIRFGEDFELDLCSYELRRAGRVLRLERIPAELLVLLIEERRQLVSRDRIIERIWGKDVFLDTDNSINAAIHKIRQVLKDDPEQPQFVQTITGRGYRFIAQVEEAGVQRYIVPSPPQQSIPPPPTPTPTKRNRTRLGSGSSPTRLGDCRVRHLARAMVLASEQWISPDSLHRRTTIRESLRRFVAKLSCGWHHRGVDN